MPLPRTKIHQVRYVSVKTDDQESFDVLAISTEDGRIILHATKDIAKNNFTKPDVGSSIPVCNPFGVLGGSAEDVTGRVKDFEVLAVPQSTNLLFVSGSSDGALRLWLVDAAQLSHEKLLLNGIDASAHSHANGGGSAPKITNPRQVGRLLSTYEAGNRITCLRAFVMFGRANPGITNNSGGFHQNNGVNGDINDGDNN